MRILGNILITVLLCLVSYIAVFLAYFSADYLLDDGELNVSASTGILGYLVVILTPLLYCVWAAAPTFRVRFRAAVTAIGMALAVYVGIKIFNTLLLLDSLTNASKVMAIHSLGLVLAIYLGLRTARRKLQLSPDAAGLPQ